MTWAATGVGIGAASLGSSVLGGMAAKKAAKKAAKAQAALTGVQRREEIRLASIQQRQQLSTSRAATYGSNLQMSGTPQSYIDAMSLNADQEMKTAKDAMALEQKAIRAGAAGAGSSLFASAIGQGFQLAGTIIQGLPQTTTPPPPPSSPSSFPTTKYT